MGSYQPTEDDVRVFRDWLKKQPYLPQDDDELHTYTIKCFITAAKGSLQKAKKCFDDHYKLSHLYSELILEDDYLHSEDAKKFNRNTAVCYLPKRTPEGYLVVVSKLLTSDPTDFSFIKHTIRVALASLITIWERDYQTGELVYLFDYTGIQLGHLRTMANGLAELMAGGMDSGQPFRFKDIHLVGLPPFAEWGLNMVKKFMSDKLQNRIHVHSSYETIHQFLPKNILPSDFGGSEPPLTEIFDKYLQKFEPFNEFLKLQVTKRKAEAKIRAAVDPGSTDTFRKIEID